MLSKTEIKSMKSLAASVLLRAQEDIKICDRYEQRLQEGKRIDHSRMTLLRIYKRDAQAFLKSGAAGFYKTILLED